MINGKKVLGIIPARGGSKGVPRKNIRVVAGKPLIAWTIAAARKSKYLDRVILSSEDAEIIAVAKKWGCEAPFVRPKTLAKDDTPGIDPVIHAIMAVPGKYDLVVLLQPTSPLRSAADIDGCIKQCVIGRHPVCVSVSEPETSPFWMFLRDKHGLIRPLMKTEKRYARRQDLPEIYFVNGAVYAADCKWLLKNRSFITAKTYGYKMPASRSLDIDSELDLLKMEALLRGQRPRTVK